MVLQPIDIQVREFKNFLSANPREAKKIRRMIERPREFGVMIDRGKRWIQGAVAGVAIGCVIIFFPFVMFLIACAVVLGLVGYGFRMIEEEKRRRHG